MSETLQPKYLTIEEASAYLRIPVLTIYQLTSTRRLRHYKPGRRLFFLPEDLDAFMRSGAVPVATDFAMTHAP